MKEWWTTMFTQASDNGAAERHQKIREAVHQNRNLVSKVQHEARKAQVLSRRATFATNQAIELLEQARKRDEDQPD